MFISNFQNNFRTANKCSNKPQVRFGSGSDDQKKLSEPERELIEMLKATRGINEDEAIKKVKKEIALFKNVRNVTSDLEAAVRIKASANVAMTTGIPYKDLRSGWYKPKNETAQELSEKLMHVIIKRNLKSDKTVSEVIIETINDIMKLDEQECSDEEIINHLSDLAALKNKGQLNNFL